MSDQVGDPHSPRDGKWWSHMLWIGRARPDRDEFNKRWAPDMSRDPVLSFICRRFLSSHIVFGLLILGGATWCGGLQFGASVTVWAIFVRLCAVLHVTWMVNSVTHMWGYRNYEQLVGCFVWLWRRVAQQPSRLSSDGKSRSSLVGI